MAKPPPDRANHPARQVGSNFVNPADPPLKVVRGGAVCDPDQGGGHIMKGSLSAAVCMPTVGKDPRPRYREAGQPVTPPSRHSVQWAQHRKGGKPIGKV
jgi:hypothetical protein